MARASRASRRRIRRCSILIGAAAVQVLAACGSRTGLDVLDSWDASTDAAALDGTLTDVADGAVSPDAAGDGGVDAGPDVIAACGFKTCADGCCSSNGECVPALQQGLGDTACGYFGEPCERCDVDAGYQCGKSGSCLLLTDGPCNASNCAGCCLSQSYCFSGRHDNTCGHSGGPCLRCNPADGTGHCELLDGGGGTCSDAGPPCSPETCAGCCTTDSVCAVGTQPFACGSAGEACTNCVFFGMKCVTGACEK